MFGGCGRSAGAPAVGVPAWLRIEARHHVLDALDRAPALDSRSRVEHDAAVGRAPDRVEVSLDDLGDLPEQQGKAQDQLAQRLAVARAAPRNPSSSVATPAAGVDQFVGLDVRRRRQPARNRFDRARPGDRRGRPRSRCPRSGSLNAADEDVGQPGAARRWTIAPVHSRPAVCTRRSSSRQPDRTADLPFNPSSTASISLT